VLFGGAIWRPVLLSCALILSACSQEDEGIVIILDPDKAEIVENGDATADGATTIVRACPSHAFEGQWRNRASNLQKNDVKRLTILGRCSGLQTRLEISVETSCGRTPCKWPAAELREVEDGTVAAIANTYSADRAIILTENDGALEGRFVSNFHSPDRENEAQEWTFDRAAGG
jgi:hypothetical protein